jgi:histidine triad (HIT) family protein
VSDCIFCKIVAGTIPSRLVHEDERMVAFRDVKPQAPVHVLLVPRKHIASLDEAGEAEAPLMAHLLGQASAIAAREGVAGAYRLVNNCGASAGQSVFHIHFHLLGGRAMGWPPG